MDLNEFTAIDQVWATDITYIPLRKGFLYLVAIVDLFEVGAFYWTVLAPDIVNPGREEWVSIQL